MIHGTFASAVFGAMMALSAMARAEEQTAPRAVPQCTGCLESLPSGQGPSPLLVILHGDGQSASTVFAKWHRWTEARGVALFAPTCPADLGCKGSWWRWNGDSDWLARRIDAISAEHPLDRNRLWIAGWSGGASYIGWRTQEIERTFAAILIHGGGMGPSFAECSSPAASVYFLVGDRNPLHSLALGLRKHYEACGQEVSWTLVHGADHEGEWSALNQATAGAILDWLAARPRRSTAVPSSSGVTEPTPVPLASSPVPFASYSPMPVASLRKPPAIRPSSVIAETGPGASSTARCAIGDGRAVQSGGATTLWITGLALLAAKGRRIGRRVS